MKKFLLVILTIIIIAVVAFFGIGLLAPPYSDTLSIEVDAPVTESFAVFNNTENLAVWMDNEQMKFKSIENISGGKNEVGSKWKMVFLEGSRELEMVETVTAFEQDRLFAFNIKDQFADLEIEVKFEERDGKTIITETSREGKELGMFSKVMITLFKGSIKKSKTEMYVKLKKLIEEK